MFTGIVEETGAIERLQSRRDVLVVEIGARRVLEDLPVGGSIAANGCCTTAVSLTDTGFACELTAETLRRTAFDERLRRGVRVNLERPMRASGRFDGHIVQGHVDALGAVRELRRLGDSAELTVALPPALERYLVEKGSVAVDGVSLTVASLGPGVFTVALIPYTLSETNLADRRPGDQVSLEADVIAKYVERLLAQQVR
ncbi:MAG TPA: riboflavin synthase [Vicinamibacteria bacterium]|nr:riboflavin synthase [Vicinamibacteria bacterium]